MEFLLNVLAAGLGVLVADVLLVLTKITIKDYFERKKKKKQQPKQPNYRR